MKTSANICKHTDELIIDWMHTWAFFFSQTSRVVRKGSGGVNVRVHTHAHCVSGRVRSAGAPVSDHLASVWFVFHFQSLKRCHIFACVLRACTLFGSAQLLRWKCHSAADNNLKKKKKKREKNTTAAGSHITHKVLNTQQAFCRLQ